MHTVYALLIGAALAALAGWSVVLNNRTPKPAGCEKLTPDCKACGITNCAVRIKNEEKEEEGIS
ncbi:MAG: hypothetical protein ACTTKS_06490 [Bulleidia sp.]